MGRQRLSAAWFLGVDRVRPFVGHLRAVLPAGQGALSIAFGSLAFIGVYAAAWAGLNAAHDAGRATDLVDQIAAPSPLPLSDADSPAATTLMVFQTPYKQSDGPAQISLAVLDEAPVGPTQVAAAEPSTVSPTRLSYPEAPALADIPTPGCLSQLRQFAQSQVIHFKIGSAAIAEDHMAMLNQLAERVQSCPEAVVQLTGHSDSSGSDLINLALSWQRADNTLAALETLGHDTSAFSTVGFGDRQPLSEGDADDEALNRRVEFRVLSRAAGAG